MDKRNRRWVWAGLAMLAGASVAPAQVLLSNFAAPATAVVGSSVTLTGCNFPAGMSAVDTLVTFTPAPGAGFAVTATANTVAVTIGTCYSIGVTVPSNLVAGNTTLTVANAATSTPVFSSVNFSTLNVTGAPIGITLNTPAAPASALPGTVITLVASGFNSSTPIPAGNVMVTIQPATGPAASVPATTDPFTAPGVMQPTFLLPNGLAPGPATVTLASASGSSPPFISITAADLNILATPPAALPLGPVSPATVAAGQAVSLKANGLPAGTIAAGNILVTLTPPPGNGAPITVPAKVYLAAIKTVAFQVSTGFTNNAPILCAVAITNKPGTLPAFALAGATVTVTPPPTVVEVTPGVGQAGTSLPAVQLVGDFTHFGTTSTLSFTPFGQSTPVSTITASSVSVQSTTQLTATLNLGANATPGAYTVNVTTGTEVAHSGAALVVTTTPGLAFNFIAPNGGALGQTLIGVQVQGNQTHFLQGSTVLDFGDGIQVTSLTVVDATDLLANISISPTTFLGARTVSAVTGGEFAVGQGAFMVQASAAALVPPLTPNSGAQGTNVVGMQITGTGTHFLPGATHVAFGGGIQTGQVTVTSPTTLTVDFSIPPSATVGPQNVTVATGGEVVGLSGAFTVTPATPFIASVTPNNGVQGQTNLDVVIAGQYTNFQPGQVTVSFGSGDITVNSVTVDPVAQTATANISIAQDAAVGGRSATLVSTTTSPSNFPFNFTVNPSPAKIDTICVSPTGPPSCVTGAPQNSAPTLLVTGFDTHWVQGTTQVTAGLGLNVDVVTITSPTTAILNATIPPSAPVGGVGITFTTGGEVVSGSFTILASTPTMTLAPPQGLQGTSVAVNFSGDFTHWCDNASFACGTGYAPTTVAIDGAGVSIQNFTINSPASASATLVVAAGATLGTRHVTLTTNLEMVQAWFTVTNTPAMLTYITPSHSGPAGTVNVEITGVYTHFESGVTTVSLGPDIAVSNVVVKSATDLTATLTLDGQAALGWRNVFVNTIDASVNLDEELTIGYSIDSPAQPQFTGLQPSSGYQGQVLTVAMTGLNTDWQQGVTQALVGAEVTVNSLTISSPTSASAEVTISPYAPLGGNPVVMITGAEVDSGPGLSVLAGPAQILGLCRHSAGVPNSDLAANTCGAGPVLVGVGQTVTVNITGQATHWEQGGTVATLGGGQVYTDSLTILDPTHATAQVTVLSTATPGFIPVTMTTLGEVATIGQGMDLVNSSPELLSTTPNGGQQGTTLNVQVLGQFTHWCDGGAVACDAGYTPTVAELPQGIASINSLTVQDSETAVLNLTVNPLAYTTPSPCPALTMTTGTEQVSLPAFCVETGPAALTSVSPNQGPQGQTTTVSITGVLTHFEAGQTVADFGTAVQAGNVQVIDATHATVDVAVTANAPVGFVTATLTTLGERAQLQQAFTVVPGTPTLNEVSATQGEQGQALPAVQIIGQYTHFCDNVSLMCGSGFTPTTVTFGQGITVSNLQIVSPTEATADLTIDPLAFTGSRNVTVTTGTETVSKYSLFQIVAGPAILSQVAPQSANQGQEVLLNLTGQNTHWQQGLTQFSIAGAGYDITVNAVIIESATTAAADVTLHPTASLGARSVYMVTAGEALTDNGALVVTGGIPAIASVAPGAAQAGTANVNVTINGLFTDWLQGGVSNVDFGTATGSGINLISYTVNSDTSITAVINISPNAPLQYNKVTVTGQTKNQNGVLGVQALTGVFQVYSSAPPTPYIQYMSPGSGLPGQTLDVALIGAYTHWDLSTTITFSAGIEVLPGTISVTSPTTALATIHIDPNATGGARTVTLDTGSEQENTSFSVVIAQPRLSIVDPGSGLQGAQGLQVNVIGSYTSFNSTTVFQFGQGITVTNTQVLGPTVAMLTLNLDQLAPLGGSGVTATTTLTSGTEVDTGAGFSVTPSLATITGVSPNTGYQGNGAGNGAAVTVTVSGEFTHWDSTTAFSFGDGITVSNVAVNAVAQTATMELAIPPLASLGGTYVRATTGGEIATLNNAFIVQAGTPIILSASTGGGGAVVEQQQTVPVVILGQVTQWDSTTTVTYGPGFLISTPVSGNPNCTGSLNPGTVGTPLVTAPTAMTVCVTALALDHTGSYTLTVATPDASQVLTLPGSLYVAAGPAAVTGLSPASGQQGQTLDVAITGTNTNFEPGVTTASFGSGISVNTLSVTGPTAASANVTVAANATPGLNTVTLATAGEVASAPSAFTVLAATPVVTFINPGNGAQGTTETVTVLGTFTHFTNATQFNFGPGITVNSVVANSAISASVGLTISPIAAVGPVAVTATTGTEVATGTNAFTVTAGAASLATVAPATGRQNQNGLPVVITGVGTHFTLALPAINLGSGITVAQVQVASDTQLTATVNLSASAPTGTNAATVTTGGEVATLAGGFTVQAGLPVVTGASPATVHQNDTSLNLTLNGLYTHWVQGTTTASASPADITVNSVTVNSATQAVANVTVSPTAALGSHTITLTTGAEVAPGVGVVSVLAGLPQLVSANPNTGAQNSTQTVTVTGLYTHFQQGVSQVSVGGGGVTVGTVTVNGPTALQVPLTVTPGAAAGARSLTVTTNSETETMNSAFTVQPGLPAISILSPNVGVPNSTTTVTITGLFTHFVGGTTQANFGAGIAVNGGAEGGFGTVAVNSATSATATLTIDPAAALGARNITVETGAEVLNVNNGYTVQSASPTAPQFALMSPADGSGNAPTNTAVTLAFTAPLDRTTVGTNNITLEDSMQGGCNLPGLAATVSVDASGRIVTLTPSEVLAVGRTYYVCINYPGDVGGFVKDPSGNQVAWSSHSFTTGFAPDTTGPALTYASIANGATGIGTNAMVVVGFNQAINPVTTASGFTVEQAGNSVAGTYGYTPDYTQITFTPAAALAANTVYTVTTTNELASPAGLGLTNPGSFSFTTGAGAVNNAPAFVSWTPRAGETTGENPVIEGVLNQPINPLATTPANFYVRNNVDGEIVTGTVSFSADRTAATLALAGPLDPGTSYSWRVYGSNTEGQAFSGYDSFTTSSAVITTPPTVVAVTPPAGSTGVAVNPAVGARLSAPVDWTSVAGALTLSPAVAATATLASDNETVSFAPSGLLAPSTVYTATLAGVRDTQGNVVGTYQWSFTTGGTATADTTAGTISGTPANGATGVATNAAVVLTLSKPADPVSINFNSARLYDQTGGVYMPGSFVLSSNGLGLTFNSAGAFPVNHRLCVYASYFQAIQDWAGNSFNYYASCFTTAAAPPDTTLPAVVAVTPNNGATGIGPNNPVTVTFSEAINPSTLNGNVGLYRGSTLYTTGYSLSADATTLIFSSGNLPYGSTFTVVINPGVSDLEGNALGAEYSSSFSTMAQPDTTAPSVAAFRPGAGATGVAATTELTFFLTQPLDPATVAGALTVAQNGALVTGSVNVSADNQVVTFTPSAAFQPGALVQIWLTGAATDASGNPLNSYQASFTVAPDVSGQAPQLTRFSPGGGAPVNTAVDAGFNQPMNPATVNAANFYVTDNGAGNALVAGTVAGLNGNTLLRFTPASPFPANDSFTVHLTNGLTNAGGIAFAGTVRGISTGSTSDTAALAVVAVAPTNGSSAIGVNALIRVTFSKPVEDATVSAATLTLSSGGNPIPYSFSDDNAGTLTLTPQAPLPASAAVTVAVTSGVSDFSANAAAPFSASFNTGAAPVYSAPQVVAATVADGDSNVPVTTVLSVTFDRAMDTRSYNYPNTIVLHDNFLGVNVPAALSHSPDGSQITVAPQAPLALGRQYSFRGCGLTDLNGNSGCWNFYYTFTTALAAAAGGPQVVETTPAAGEANLGVNLLPEIVFDRPVARPSVANVQLLQGGTVPVPYTASFANGDTLVTLAPSAVLLPNTNYVLSIGGVTDTAGTAMGAAVAVPFTTGAGLDLAAPQVVSATPLANATTGTNPVIRIRFNEPVDPIRTSNTYLQNAHLGVMVAGMAVHYSADRMTMTITYPGTLDPNTPYRYFAGYLYDPAGNTQGSPSWTFTTGAGPDTTAPTVAASSPAAGAGNVALNAVVQLQMSEPLDPTLTGAGTLTVSGAAGNVSLSSDGYTLTFTPSAPLAASTLYTVTGTGLTDLAGNVGSYSATFTTGTVAASGAGTVNLTSPAPGATGVSASTGLTLVFNRPVNPLTVNPSTVAVQENGNQVAGTITLASDDGSLVFTPLAPLPANTVIHVYASYFASLLDQAGNAFSYLATSFTTGAAGAPTAPTVEAETPQDGASQVGPNAVVTLVFSESLNRNTVNSSTFALYSGPNNLNAGVNISSDNRTVTLNQTLPYSATITVSVSTAVQDLLGNALAAPFRSSFTTIAPPQTATPTVTQMRPANGATGVGANSPITLYTSAAVNAATLAGNLVVTENGTLAAGSATLAASGQAIVFTPTAPFPLGAVVQVFLSPAVTDSSNYGFSSFAGSFTVQPDLSGVGPSLVSLPQNASGLPTNTAIVAVFNKAIDPTTVTAGTFYAMQNGVPVAATLAQPEPNVLRLQPTAALAANTGGAFYLTSGLKDLAGHAFSGGGWGMNTGSGPDSTLPAVQAVTPANGSTGVGDNAGIRILFSKAIDTTSINSSTVTLTSASIPLPYNLSFNTSNGATVVTLTPQAPLPDAATVTLGLGAGVMDYEGNALAPEAVSFQTENGPDFNPPQVVYQSPASNQTSGVPASLSFVWVFNKAIDPATAGRSLYDSGSNSYVGINAQVSPDGKTLTLTPAAPLSLSTQYQACESVQDLEGNGPSSACVYVTTASASSAVAPQVELTTPTANLTGVATNAFVELVFNEPLAGNTLGGIALSTGGNPVPASAGLVFDGSVVRLTPQSLLLPNTTYTVTVAGVQDLGGDNMAGPDVFSFTTGPNPQIGGTQFLGASVLVGGVGTPLGSSPLTGVDDNTTITVKYSSPIEMAALLHGSGITLATANTNTPVPFTLALSADGTTVTLTPTGPLAAATQYTVGVDYFATVYDLEGYGVGGYGYFKFTTQ